MAARKTKYRNWYSNRFTSSQLIQITLVIVLILGVFFTTKLVKYRQNLASNAALGDTPLVNAVLSFSPPAPDNPQIVNQQFTTHVLVDTADQGIYAVDAKILFDPSLLEVISILPTEGNGFGSYPLKKFNNDKGEIDISANIGGGNSTAIVSSALDVASITFRVKANIDSTAISYRFTLGNRNDSNVVPEYRDQRKGVTDILSNTVPLVITTGLSSPAPSASVEPSSTPQPSVTPSLPPSSPIPSDQPVPSPSVSPLNISLKVGLQGKSDVVASQNITFTYTYSNFRNLQTASLVTTPDSLINLSLFPGDYMFLLKSPSYLARAYGTVTLPISIRSDIMNYDLSLDPLLGGDFNNDGVINEVDYAAYFLTAFAGSDESIDLDGSGQVNNLDFAIMRSNWGLVDDTI